MSTIAVAVKHLLACGASHEAVVRAVEEMEARRRNHERDRKREYRSRLSHLSRDNGTKERSPTPPKENKPPVSPTEKHAPRGEFDQFWEVYPRKVAKGAAKKAYRNALKRATAEEILAGAKRYAKFLAGSDPQFIAHAASWLNADRWLDEPDKLPKPVGAKGTEGFVAEWGEAAKRQVEEREKIVKPPAEDREAQVARYLKARPMP